MASTQESSEDAADEGPGGAVPPRRIRRRVLLLALGGAVVALAAWEMGTSRLQAWWVSHLVANVGYDVEHGPSPRIVFPEAGPYDVRLGYVRLPGVVDTLTTRSFRVDEQARVTARFLDLTRWGVYPLYREKAAGGLRVVDRQGRPIHESLHPRIYYQDFDSIPPLLWRSLLWIEDRTLLDPDRPTKNPAVDWGRLARGVTELGLKALGSDRNVPGGSTLATQIEKFRHSPDGLTRTPRDKLRQMATATARAYLDGPETLGARRDVLRRYLNTVPLAAQRGHGEVVGTAEGLWAWYGTSFDEANRLLRGEALDSAEAVRRGAVYRQALSLLLAHRRPSYYLATEAGREELATLTDRHLRLLEDAGVVPSDVAELARAATVDPLPAAPELPRAPFLERKTASQLRTHLMGLLGAPSLYDLDRYDLDARATLDFPWQRETLDLFRNLSDPAFARGAGFMGDRMLDRGELDRVVYSFTLLERTPLGNVIRIQADNYDGPLSLTEGGRLELGSTAKLRTLVSYLEAVTAIHGSLAAAPQDSLRALDVPERDRLTRWVVDELVREPDLPLATLLRRAMQRTYSASTGERFATGGGVQTFSNFDDAFDGRTLTVQEALRHSVNLPWIRIMRDVVHHHMFREGTTARMLEDPGVRQDILARFADREGSRFVRQFHRKYADLSRDGILEALVRERDLSPERTAWAYRTVVPDPDPEAFATFVRGHARDAALSEEALASIWRRTDPSPFPLADLGYLSRVHPLELWVAGFLVRNPEAGAEQALEASADVRQEVYQWLFRTRNRNAQDQRIRTVLEIEAFQAILARWRELGYPFQNLVPSYGTAIGSSGDRPLALAELVGIVVNEGNRLPVVRFDELRFAPETPYETRMTREPAEARPVMAPEVAAVVREALVDVVENGTGRRARGAVLGPDGAPLVMGGKTGTGDNRYRVYGPGGNLVESRTVNRTAAFTFFLGDRYYGVVTAYVAGPEAARYGFTSGVPTQILRTLGPALSRP